MGDRPLKALVRAALDDMGVSGLALRECGWPAELRAETIEEGHAVLLLLEVRVASDMPRPVNAKWDQLAGAATREESE